MGADKSLFIRYGGTWEESSNTYVGGQLKGILVPPNVTYSQLQERLFKVTEVNPSEFDIIVRVPYDLAYSCPPMYISDDDDLRFALVQDQVSRVPLFVSTVVRNGVENCNAGNAIPVRSSAPQDGGSGCTHNAQPSLAHGYEQAYNEAAPVGEGRGWGSDDVLDECDNCFNPGLDTNVETIDEVPPMGDELPTVDGCPNSSCDIPVEGFPASTASAIDCNVPVTGEQLTEYGPYVSDGELYVGKVFLSKKDLQLVLAKHALRTNKEYKVHKSNPSLLYIRCIDSTCNWKVTARSVGRSTIFSIIKYVGEHTCSIDGVHNQHPQASSWVVANLIKEKLRGTGRTLKIRHIIEDMRKEHGVTISYDKAYRARELGYAIVRGIPEESYSHLHAYGEALKLENPGTVFTMESDDNVHFKYMFMSLGASISGFRTLTRHVVMVDGTHLKGKYKGVLLIGVAMDGNNQIYPIGFAIVENESDASWKWFMQNMKNVFGEPDDLVIISDRHLSIINAESFHGMCTYHLSKNIKSRFKNSAITDLFSNAAYAFRESQFKSIWDQIAMYAGGSASRYLEGIGLERWARCYQIRRRYVNMTTNSAESVNAVLREARELPVTLVLEYIRDLLQRWFYERRTYWSTRTASHSDYAEKILAANFERSRTMVVKPVDWCTFQVDDMMTGGRVDLTARTCTCKEFDSLQIPCSHAVAAIRNRNLNPHSFIDSRYSVETLVAAYAEPINPVGHMSEWRQPADFQPMPLQPPAFVSRVGRRRSSRIPSRGERSRVSKCSRCGLTGHNRTTCNNSVSQATHV